MRKYKIYYGMGGSFRGGIEKDIVECLDSDEALEMARERAIEEYQSYEGLHGIRGYDEILEEIREESETWYFVPTEIEIEEEADRLYQEEMDSWLEYGVEED